MKALNAILLTLLVVVQYKLWLGDGGLFKLWQLEAAVEAQQAQNKQLLERNKALAAEVLDLKQGLGAIEERARTELGMIKKGETFFQIVE